MKRVLEISIVVLALMGVAPGGAFACGPMVAAVPGQADTATLSATTVCLMNVERSRHGLAPLRTSHPLAMAAFRHSGDMAARNYFSHGAGPTSLVSRLRAVRYIPSKVAWGIGENIAWGTGPMGSPQHTVSSWMRSASHRANILKRSFREVGVGVAITGPKALFTADFGFRG